MRAKDICKVEKWKWGWSINLFSFLLDRLLQYENVEDSSSDSDMTASSDSETEGVREASSSKKFV